MWLGEVSLWQLQFGHEWTQHLARAQGISNEGSSFITLSPVVNTQGASYICARQRSATAPWRPDQLLAAATWRQSRPLRHQLPWSRYTLEEYSACCWCVLASPCQRPCVQLASHGMHLFTRAKGGRSLQLLKRQQIRCGLQHVHRNNIDQTLCSFRARASGRFRSKHSTLVSRPPLTGMDSCMPAALHDLHHSPASPF